MAAAEMAEVHWFVAGPRNVAIAPGCQRGKDRNQLATSLGQHIIMARRPFSIGAGFDQAALRKFLEA